MAESGSADDWVVVGRNKPKKKSKKNSKQRGQSGTDKKKDIETRRSRSARQAAAPGGQTQETRPEGRRSGLRSANESRYHCLIDDEATESTDESPRTKSHEQACLSEEEQKQAVFLAERIQHAASLLRSSKFVGHIGTGLSCFVQPDFMLVARTL